MAAMRVAWLHDYKLVNCVFLCETHHRHVYCTGSQPVISPRLRGMT